MDGTLDNYYPKIMKNLMNLNKDSSPQHIYKVYKKTFNNNKNMINKISKEIKKSQNLIQILHRK